MNGADQTDRKKETRTRGSEQKRGKEGEGGTGGILRDRRIGRPDERKRGSGTRNCTALEKIAFPLIISSRG